MAFIGGILPQRAWQLGFDWCEVRLSNWGRYDSTDLYSVEFPQIPAEYFPPLAGIAIAPSSHVSKAIIWCNDGVTRPVEVDYDPITPPFPKDYRTDYTGTSQFVITRERPWLTNINTSNGEVYFGSEAGAATAPQLRRIKVIAHPDTRWQDIYTPDGTETNSTFGLALNAGQTDPVFISPELHLTLFFRKAPAVSSARESFYNIGMLPNSAGSTTERLTRVFPISGRGKFRLSLSPYFRHTVGQPSSSSFNVRVAAVKQGFGAFDVSQFPLLGWWATNNTTETQIGQVTSLSATHGGIVQQATITGSLDDYSFLLVYVTDILGGQAFMKYQFSAWDE